jgi:hypothetical protein
MVVVVVIIIIIIIITTIIIVTTTTVTDHKAVRTVSDPQAQSHELIFAAALKVFLLMLFLVVSSPVFDLLSFLSRVVSNFVDVILFFVAACRHARYS